MFVLHWSSTPLHVTAKQKYRPPCNSSATRELVLIVDSDQRYVRDITSYFSEANLDVVTAASGEDGWKCSVNLDPAVVTTEVELPGMSGFDLCRRLTGYRKTADIPIVFVTERDNEIDRVVGFELGATDYVVKPVNQRELTLRVLRILKRVRGFTSDGTLRFGQVFIDLNQSIVTRRGERLDLSPTEFRILSALARAHGRVLTRDEIIERAWRNRRAVMARTVDAHVKSIRTKVTATGLEIVTVRRAGYSLRYEPEGRERDGNLHALRRSKTPEGRAAYGHEKLRESSGI
jgi:two-component system response regulator BaeR